MKSRLIIWAVSVSLLAAAPLLAQEKKAEKKKKAEKASGNVGLLDLQKNYMILVTKEGKLVSLDFNNKSKVTVLNEESAKVEDIGLGSSASIEYTEKDGKKNLSKIEFLPAKGGE